MHHTPLLTTLAAGFVLAFLFGALANRLRISPLVGYLLAGVLAGPFTPGYVADQALSQEIAELGVILLMFGVGLHFSLKDLLSVKAIAIPGALVQIGVATLLGIGLAKLLGWSFGGGLVFGLSLSVASTVVLLRALEQRQLLDTKRGRIAIGWLIVEDLAMVLTLVLLPALAGTLGGKTDGGDAGLLWPLLITLGKVAAFVALMIFGGRRVVPWVLERIAASGSRELFTLAVLAIALGIAYGSAAAYLIVRAFGHPNSTALVIAASLAQIGEFSFILIGLGIGLELVPEQSRDLVLAGAILSILVNPLLFIAIDRLQQRKEQRLAEAAGGVREMPAQDLPPPILEREHAVLIGHGRVGGLVSARLRAAGTPFVVVVDKRDKADELREQGYSVVLGNAASPGVLELANIAEARWLLIAIPNGFEAGQIASHARAVNPPLDIVARAHFDAEVDYLEQNGANLVIMGEREIACGMVHRLGLDRDERGADAPLPQSA